MTRRQREGRGGRDFNGHGTSVCWCCANRRGYLGPTFAELAQREDLADTAADSGPLGPDDSDWSPITRLVLFGECDG